MRAWFYLTVFAIALGAAPPATEAAPAAGHITGVGGIFVRSPNPKALAHWYRDVLGITLESWGGAALSTDAPHHPPVVVWNAFPQATKYMARSSRDFMVDFAVDDLNAMLTRLAAKDVKILGRSDAGANGKFAWIMDPDGTKIEFWQPNPR